LLRFGICGVVECGGCVVIEKNGFVGSNETNMQTRCKLTSKLLWIYEHMNWIYRQLDVSTQDRGASWL